MIFLQNAAQHIFDLYTPQTLHRVCVVLPSRRAVFYFKRALANLSDTPFRAPQVMAIDDFVMQHAEVNAIDSLQLIIELFEIYKELDPKVDFTRFVSWGTTLLQDFNIVDQYLLDNPKALFDYLRDAHQLKFWQPEQTNQPPSAGVAAYFKLFENISAAYQRLQQKLAEKQLAYRGMAYRKLAQEVEAKLLTNRPFEHIFFVGLNALSHSEEHLIKHLAQAGFATTLWDSDAFYMASDHKAGQMLRRYKREGIFGTWNWQTDDLLSQPKDIRLMGLTTKTLQAKVAGELYARALATHPAAETAIVLADEQLLQPLLFALDETVQDYNITMGVSLRYSLLATLVEAIFEMQRTVVEFRTKDGEIKKIPKYNHRHIHKVLNHAFVRMYEAQHYPDEVESPFRRTLRFIIEQNRVYLSEKELLELAENDPLCQTLFKRWYDNPRAALACFRDLVDFLRAIFKSSPNAIEIEFLFQFLTLLHRLEGVMKSYPSLSIANFRYFLNDLLRQEKIPFSGEPVANLQIISLLETRCLDFEHVIFVSLNDGKLPTSTKINSLIPFDAATEFGLPMYHQHEAVMAYHFYRLIQRAKRVDLLYLEPSGTGVGGGNEPSRFIQQIKHELVKRNPAIRLQQWHLGIPQSENVGGNRVITVPKTEQVCQDIHFLLKTKGLYPSQLSDYMKCSLKFYFAKIAKLADREEVDENFGQDVFGNWLHLTLEHIDKDYTGNGEPMTADKIQQIITEIPARLQAVYEEKYSGYVLDGGANALQRHIAEKVLIDFFNDQLKRQMFPFEVLETERELAVHVDVPLQNEVIKVRIAGKVDRIEQVNDTVVVVDYKTGKVNKKDIEAKDNTLREKLQLPEFDKLRQLWLYQYLVVKKLFETKDLLLKGKPVVATAVQARIYSFRNIQEDLSAYLSFTTGESPLEFVRESEKLLQEVVQGLLDPNTPFCQPVETTYCEYCNFKVICGR